MGVKVRQRREVNKYTIKIYVLKFSQNKRFRKKGSTCPYLRNITLCKPGLHLWHLPQSHEQTDGQKNATRKCKFLLTIVSRRQWKWDLVFPILPAGWREWQKNSCLDNAMRMRTCRTLIFLFPKQSLRALGKTFFLHKDPFNARINNDKVKDSQSGRRKRMHHHKNCPAVFVTIERFYCLGELLWGRTIGLGPGRRLARDLVYSCPALVHRLELVGTGAYPVVLALVGFQSPNFEVLRQGNSKCISRFLFLNFLHLERIKLPIFSLNVLSILSQATTNSVKNLHNS